MDMRQYASTYIKPDNVRDGPIRTRIVNVFESERLGRPVLELETGSQFTLNDGNTNVLINAWGHNSDDWIGQEVELALGTYKDWRSDPVVDKRRLGEISRREWWRAGGEQTSFAGEQDRRAGRSCITAW
jgi:hypothetical protein